MSVDANGGNDAVPTTTWGYRFRCPQCGFESVTQDEELREELITWHEQKDHDGRKVCKWEHDGAIPVSEFPDDEDPELEAVTVTQRALEADGNV